MAEDEDDVRCIPEFLDEMTVEEMIRLDVWMRMADARQAQRAATLKEPGEARYQGRQRASANKELTADARRWLNDRGYNYWGRPRKMPR